MLLILSCSNDPITSVLENSNLKLDTLSISNVDISNYTVYPNIGLNSRLYLGTKNHIEVPYTFVQMTKSKPS